MKYKPKPEAHIFNRKNDETPSNEDVAGQSDSEPNKAAEETTVDGSAVGVDSSLENYADIFDGSYFHGGGSTYLDDLEDFKRFLSENEDYASLPDPEVFNAYPPEVQRKIMEWTDRDVKARRDDESRRQDEMMRARISRERTRTIVPLTIILIAIVCAAITGIVTGNPVFAVAFLVIPIAVIIAILVMNSHDADKGNKHRRSPYIGNQQ